MRPDLSSPTSVAVKPTWFVSRTPIRGTATVRDVTTPRGNTRMATGYVHMTAAQLIEKLKTFPPDAEAMSEGCDGCTCAVKSVAIGNANSVDANTVLIEVCTIGCDSCDPPGKRS